MRRRRGGPEEDIEEGKEENGRRRGGEIGKEEERTKRRKGRQPTFSMLAPLSRSSMTSSTLPLQGEERLEGIRGHVHLGWGE